MQFHVHLRYEVLGSAKSDGLGDLGPVRWQMVLVYLLAFILVVLALSKSIKSSGKVQNWLPAKQVLET